MYRLSEEGQSKGWPFFRLHARSELYTDRVQQTLAPLFFSQRFFIFKDFSYIYNMKKIGNILIIIMMLVCGFLMHGILGAAAKIIPFPIVLGMVGGFALGWVYFSKIKK